VFNIFCKGTIICTIGKIKGRKTTGKGEKAAMQGRKAG
jgi:hypothetical protein